MNSMRSKLLLPILLATGVLPVAFAADSEDALIKNLHWLGPINGQTNILRCASPTMDIAEKMRAARPTAQDLKLARDRMQRLRDIGIRTVISFQHQTPPADNETNAERVAVALEKGAAEELGLAYVAYPMSNKGTNSFEDMSTEAVINLLDPISEDIFKFAQNGLRYPLPPPEVVTKPRIAPAALQGIVVKVFLPSAEYLDDNALK